MNRILMIAALLLGSVMSARAAADPVSVEVKWNEKTVSITTTGVTSATFDIGGFGAYGAAFLGNPAKFNGVDGSTYGQATVVTSTWSNVTAFGYVFYASATLSANFPSLQIAQTIKMPTPNGYGLRQPSNMSGYTSTSTYNSPYPTANFFTAPVTSTSTTITEPNGVLVTHHFRAQVTNPIFYMTGLTSSATYMLTVDYGVPRAQ